MPTHHHFTGPGAYETAERYAKRGHRDFVCYRARAGLLHAEPATPEAIKRALLAVGTKGKFSKAIASTGHRMRETWRTGLNWMYHALIADGRRAEAPSRAT